MSDEADASLKQHPDWKKTRLVWAATGKDLPGKPGKNDLHYLAELKAAGGSYLSAKEITLADREREWTPDQVANQCEALAQVLYQRCCQINANSSQHDDIVSPLCRTKSTPLGESSFALNLKRISRI